MTSFLFTSAGVVLEFDLGFVLFVTLAHDRGLSDVKYALDESDWVFWETPLWLGKEMMENLPKRDTNKNICLRDQGRIGTSNNVFLL